jgi:hypothetical protein
MDVHLLNICMRATMQFRDICLRIAVCLVYPFYIEGSSSNSVRSFLFLAERNVDRSSYIRTIY